MQTTRYKHIPSLPRNFPTSGASVTAGEQLAPLPVPLSIPGLQDLDESPVHATLADVEPARVTLSGDLSGDYVIEDRRPDGRVVLRPDLSVQAMLARHGERKLTPEEFERHFGQLPTDGEG